MSSDKETLSFVLKLLLLVLFIDVGMGHRPKEIDSGSVTISIPLFVFTMAWFSFTTDPLASH